MRANDTYNVLFIVSGPAAPGTTINDNPFYYLSNKLKGHVIGQTWNYKTQKEADDYINSISPSFEKFKYHAFITPSNKGVLKHLALFKNYFQIGRKILKNEKIDLIMSYGFFTPGITASILSKLFNIPLLVEVPGVSEKAIEYSDSSFKAIAKFLLKFSMIITLSRARSVWLLFKNQLNEKQLAGKKVFISHEFAPVSMFNPHHVSEKIISFLGFPWKLKGVDILIEAFKLVLNKHPDAKLRIAGYCPDKTPYFKQIKGFEDNITLHEAMSREESVKFIEATKIFVLPSRTEAMGRVILEAMSAQKVVIGSNVDGIPHYIKDKENGLLFQSENVDDLAKKIITLLDDNNQYEFLSKNAREYVYQNLKEADFAQNFYNMVVETINNNSKV